MLGVFLLFPTWPGGVTRSSAEPLFSGIGVQLQLFQKRKCSGQSGLAVWQLPPLALLHSSCQSSSQEGGHREPLVPGVGCGCSSRPLLCRAVLVNSVAF